MILSEIIAKVKKNSRKIVLPEIFDKRIILAAKRLISEKIVDVILLGNKEQIFSFIKDDSIASQVTIYDPQENNSTKKKLMDYYYNRRKHKGLTLEQATEIITSKPYFFGAMLVAVGLADGMAAGATCSTGEIIRSIIHSVGKKPNSSLISSFFIMITDNILLGDDGVLFFADCAVNPNPTEQELAEIAADTGESFEKIMSKEPRLALLSFSTKGNAKHELITKVSTALKIARYRNPKLLIDGELQLDAAIIPEIGQKKAPDSTIAGRANCLIFPDLQSGNIGYKLTQRIGKAVAVGPIIQGAAKPINDLSRGCSVDDIVSVAAITSLQAQ